VQCFRFWRVIIKRGKRKEKKRGDINAEGQWQQMHVDRRNYEARAGANLAWSQLEAFFKINPLQNTVHLIAYILQQYLIQIQVKFIHYRRNLNRQILGLRFGISTPCCVVS
jgi:hypothetical protein